MNLRVPTPTLLASTDSEKVMADPGGATFMAAPPKPVGGHVVAHFSTTRLGLRKGPTSTSKIRLLVVFFSSLESWLSPVFLHHNHHAEQLAF